MKVVINRSFGGFGLSNIALKRYVELKGLTPYFYDDDFKNEVYNKTDEHTNDIYSYCVTEDLGDTISFDDFWDWQQQNEDKYIYDKSIERTDEDLIQVVEELGELVNLQYSSLKVVEIPDDVEWQIDSFDGMETIEEVHRSWC